MRFLPRVIIAVVGSAVGIGILVLIAWLAMPGGTTIAGKGQSPVDLPDFPPASSVTRAPAGVAAQVATRAAPAWIASTAERTGIPARALEAYAGVALDIEQQNPTCGIGWNTLAAIGEIESRHGTIFGGSIQADGTASPAIFGVALNGEGFADIPDSDGGTIDGDAEADRAVGPMQLIPQTWRNWHVDANGDGVQNPQNIDDATLASAHYLCRAGKDLTAAAGWRAAVLAYNSSDEYLTDVIRYAVGYAGQAAK
jgi:membrane-bound lytic murein transglycosylase B